MNGFVAKSMVSEISKAQEQYLPEVKDMLQQLQSAQDAAVKAAQEEVAKQFSATLAKQKQDAYAQAEAAARKAIMSNPPKELTSAIQQAEDAARAAAKQQIDAQFAARGSWCAARGHPRVHGCACRCADGGCQHGKGPGSESSAGSGCCRGPRRRRCPVCRQCCGRGQAAGRCPGTGSGCREERRRKASWTRQS